MDYNYPDDSYTLHTDAYELSMMQTYYKRVGQPEGGL